MDKKRNVAVVLAGGRSSRMGRDKAFLDFKGKPLIDHMIGLLQKTGLEDVYVSGDAQGYQNIPDSKNFSGPACAMVDVLDYLTDYDGVLFVPVDMPFLSIDVLQILLQSPDGGYFEGYPLPVFISSKRKAIKNPSSVHKLLDELGVSSIIMDKQYENTMLNLNTPEEWQKVI